MGRLKKAVRYMQLAALIVAAVFMIWMFFYGDLKWSALFDSGGGRGKAFLFWIVMSPVIVAVLLVHAIYKLIKGEATNEDE